MIARLSALLTGLILVGYLLAGGLVPHHTKPAPPPVVDLVICPAHPTQLRPGPCPFDGE